MRGGKIESQVLRSKMIFVIVFKDRVTFNIFWRFRYSSGLISIYEHVFDGKAMKIKEKSLNHCFNSKPLTSIAFRGPICTLVTVSRTLCYWSVVRVRSGLDLADKAADGKSSEKKLFGNTPSLELM